MICNYNLSGILLQIREARLSHENFWTLEGIEDGSIALLVRARYMLWTEKGGRDEEEEVWGYGAEC